MDSTSHAVPQNVTDFQFHLVGDMTIKQFGYLGTGMAAAYLTYVIFSSIAPYFAYPLVVIFAGSGAALAFIPIQERPLDQWLLSFVKAIFRPTQLKYKSATFSKEDPNFNNRIQLYFQYLNAPVVAPVATVTAPAAPIADSVSTPPASNRTSRPISELINQAEATAQNAPAEAPAINPAPVSKLPTSEQIDKTLELAKQAQNIQTAIIESEHELNEIKTNAAQVGSDPKQFSQKFQQELANLQQLNEAAAQISQKQTEFTRITLPSPSVTPQDAKITILPNRPKSIPTMTLTSTPNLINGIITDALGNYVEQAIIVAHDRQGVPVRALKSNKLGQFIAATPLPSGTFIINVERDNLLFDTIQIELDGAVLKPILIAAKRAERSVSV